MGLLLLESAEKGFQTALEALKEKVDLAGLDNDGNVHIEFRVTGATTETINFSITGNDELLEILRLNTE